MCNIVVEFLAHPSVLIWRGLQPFWTKQYLVTCRKSLLGRALCFYLFICAVKRSCSSVSGLVMLDHLFLLTVSCLSCTCMYCLAECRINRFLSLLCTVWTNRFQLPGYFAQAYGFISTFCYLLTLFSFKFIFESHFCFR